MHNVSVETDTLYRTLYEPITITFNVGVRHKSTWGEGVEIGGRMSYPVKARTIAHKLSVQSETLSLSVYELDALHIFGLWT